MVAPANRFHDDNGAVLAQLSELVMTVREKLVAMEAVSSERNDTVKTIATVQQLQQQQINQLVTDMAILKTQHASFWKGITVLLGILTTVGAGIGFVVAQAVSLVHTVEHRG